MAVRLPDAIDASATADALLRSRAWRSGRRRLRGHAGPGSGNGGGGLRVLEVHGDRVG